MFVSDSHYAIGKGHLTCQDYALNGQDPVPFAVIADGCSSSKDSDMGARLLSLAAKEYLSDHFSRTSAPPSYRKMGLMTALKAQASGRALGIDDRALDATLLMAFVAGERGFAYVFGDGFVITRDRAGCWRTLRFEYSHNAPFYPSYLCTPARLCEYRSFSRGQKKRVRDTDKRSQGDFDCRSKSVLVFAAHDIDLLAVVSDGLDSFVNRSDKIRIRAEDMATEILTSNTRSPGFIKRRTRRGLRNLAAKRVFPADDLSVGALVRSEWNSGEPS